MEDLKLSIKKRIMVLGIPINIVPPEDLEATIKALSGNKEKNQIVLINLRGLMRARRNSGYHKLLNEAGLVLPTSLGILRIAKFLGKSVPYRYNPYDFIIRVLGILEKMGGSVYLLGGQVAQLQISAANLKASFPGLHIVGRCHGFYNKKIEEDIITAIKKSSPNLLLAGSGLKGKDRWIFLRKSQFNSGIYLWDNDCFEIFAGKKKRIPKALFNKGLENLPLLIRRPWLLLRILLYPYYGVLILIHKIRKL